MTYMYRPSLHRMPDSSYPLSAIVQLDPLLPTRFYIR